MSIRLRLVLSYIAMLLVPLVLFGLALAALSLVFLGHIGSLYKVDFKGNPVKHIMQQEAVVYAAIKERAEVQPDSLLDGATLTEWDEALSKFNMGLIVRSGQDVVYESSILPALSKAGIGLPVYGQELDSPEYQHGEGLWLTHKLDFQTSDGSQGTVFIAMDGSPLQGYLAGFARSVLIAFVVILVLTNGALTYLVSRSIIRPLRALQRATEAIKEGNLDMEVVPRSRDEIGELSRAFEEMRRKLKHSVELQLQYEENRKELISNISHDLKTPVTAIKGYVEGIMDGVTNSPDKLDRYVRTIYTKAVDMDRMIDELFLFSKLDLGRLPFQFETVALDRYIADCAQELQYDMEASDIRFELAELPAAALNVTADREKLKRVLLNVIGNAVKYRDDAKAESRIRLSVQRIDGQAVIQVEDNGQGIPAEALPHIFDRFYRADPSRNSATGGSGLGLAIAKQIVAEHGGLIWADSTAGQGTTVFIALPLAGGREGDKTDEQPHTDH
ncbi:HAMP domain-containing histidine kinase [Paenibacillus athensensis]|uniref:histidine kinase n=1 Tax=Paenibacillus athensensis TaxID=1967502 RepID=A0A4Y8Q665_9BACL|nr:HAMP domain-containing sensor histidine kinase [Paenibacillus athensensis]MCD1259623.1 HAMP domain-containing histidine kinase [Paenibacillus athensensis]